MVLLLLTACTTNGPSKVTTATLGGGLQLNLAAFWGFSVGCSALALPLTLSRRRSALAR